MNYYIKALLVSLCLLISCTSVYASEVRAIHSFDELMNSDPENGDTLDIENDLTSDTSIENKFINLDINIEGHNHFLDGRDSFSGFIFNQDTNFNQVRMLHCKGQRYSTSSFAGAIFNNSGNLNLQNAAFIDNFVNSDGLSFGVAGALYNLNDGHAIIDSTLFSGNYTNGASSYGGAIANGNNTNQAVMSINNSVFYNNYSYGTVVPYGGAIYNSGTIDINNSLFENNYVLGADGTFAYGGAIYNIGKMVINNSQISNSYAKGGNTSYALGGAIFNNADLEINNSIISNNHIDSEFYSNGGAIYNNVNGNLTIRDSLLENNYVDTNVQIGEGGAIYNGNKLVIENSTFKNNHDKDGELNDIFNTQTGAVEFNADGTTNILSGIKGGGTIAKNDSGVLNLGGINKDFTGDFNFNGGTVNLLANSSYFNAQNTNFGDNINFNMLNNSIDNVNFGNLTLSGKTNISADVNFNNNTMDRISASSINGSGSLFVNRLGFEGAPQSDFISIPFADSVLKNYVHYTPSTIKTPIYNYSSSYDSADGNFEFIRGGLNSSVYVPAVATQLAGYFNQLDTYRNVFSNLDMVMITSPEVKRGYAGRNKIAYGNRNFTFSPIYMPEQRGGIWFKPYSMFENVPLRNGPRVSNVSYGSLVGGESPLQELKNGWYALYGAYASYNGSHQAFSGNSIYNNGGLIGADAAFYKGKFFSLWTANVGANAAEATTEFGRDEFGMINTGIAQKTGYNFETKERRFIIQPSIMTSYSFVNTFNYTTSANVHMDTEPLHALHIEPQLKFIANFKNYWQPYIAVSFAWNIIDHARFQADDVYLPDLSVKPYVQYGIGVQKRWGERLTCFIESMFRNGGREGVALQLGFRFSL